MSLRPGENHTSWIESCEYEANFSRGCGFVQGSGCISVPFAAAKMMAVWIMLRDFPAVIKSESYMRQIKSDNDDDIAEVDASFS